MQQRKVRVGLVVSTKMDKTVVVAVRWQQRHPIYKKSIRHITRFYVHDEENTCSLGDVVRIEETRALSLTKRWRLSQIIERHEVAEIKPAELDEGLLSEEADAAEADAEEADAAEADAAEADAAEADAEEAGAEEADATPAGDEEAQAPEDEEE